MQQPRPYSLSIVLRSLLGIREYFICRLYGLKFGVEFHLMPWVSIRMVLESCIVLVDALVRKVPFHGYLTQLFERSFDIVSIGGRSEF